MPDENGSNIITEAYPGNGEITDLKNTCEVRGWKMVAKLKSVKHGTMVKDGAEKFINIAKYESKEWRNDTWKELIFVELKDGDNLDTIKNEHKDKAEFIFADDLYIKEKIKKVVGFGVKY